MILALLLLLGASAHADQHDIDMRDVFCNADIGIRQDQATLEQAAQWVLAQGSGYVCREAQ